MIHFQFKIFHPFCGFESKTELKAKIAVLYLTGRVFHFLKTTREPDWRQSVRTNNRRIQEIGQLNVQGYGRNVNRHGGTSNQRNISKSRVHPDLDGAWWVEWILFDWVKTLIELMIMGGRIWKTDDSVSTRDFSFLSDISLLALTARCSIYPATEMQTIINTVANKIKKQKNAHCNNNPIMGLFTMTLSASTVQFYQQHCIQWTVESAMGNRKTCTSYSVSCMCSYSADNVDIEVVEYLLLAIHPLLLFHWDNDDNENDVDKDQRNPWQHHFSFQLDQKTDTG